jgi:hypothetical protein
MFASLALPLTSPKPPNSSKNENRPAFVKRKPMRHLWPGSIHSQKEVAGTRQRHSALSQPRQYGDFRLRTFVTGTAPRFGGGGKPQRIKARAIDRIGELAEEVPPAKNQHDAAERARGGVTPSRSQVASDAGISPDQLKTALRVHKVPREEFERQVESDNPPTITAMARLGSGSRQRDSLGALFVSRRLVDFLARRHDPQQFVR